MIIENFASKLIQEPLKVVWQRYRNGEPAMYLHDEIGEIAHVATVNLDMDMEGIRRNLGLTNKVVFIKNYSENEGVLETLVENKIIKRTGYKVKSGFVEIEACEVLIPIEE